MWLLQSMGFIIFVVVPIEFVDSVVKLFLIKARQLGSRHGLSDAGLHTYIHTYIHTYMYIHTYIVDQFLIIISGLQPLRFDTQA